MSVTASALTLIHPLSQSPAERRDLTEISMYVGANGRHAPAVWFRLLREALSDICNHEGSAAAMGLERGTKNEHLHFQIIIRMMTVWPMYKKQLVDYLKHRLCILKGSGMRCKIEPREFKNQTWKFMIGYVQKDKGRSHYKFWSKNINADELEAGIRSYDLVCVVCLLCTIYQ